MIRSGVGTNPAGTFVPAARGTTGMPRAAAYRRVATTSSARAARTTAPGTPRCVQKSCPYAGSAAASVTSASGESKRRKSFASAAEIVTRCLPGIGAFSSSGQSTMAVCRYPLASDK